MQLTCRSARPVYLARLVRLNSPVVQAKQGVKHRCTCCSGVLYHSVLRRDIARSQHVCLIRIKLCNIATKLIAKQLIPCASIGVCLTALSQLLYKHHPVTTLGTRTLKPMLARPLVQHREQSPSKPNTYKATQALIHIVHYIGPHA